MSGETFVKNWNFLSMLTKLNLFLIYDLAVSILYMLLSLAKLIILLISPF